MRTFRGFAGSRLGSSGMFFEGSNEPPVCNKISNVTFSQY